MNLILPGQAYIHLVCSSTNADDRVEIAWSLRKYFPNLPDKAQAWQDLHRLTRDRDIWVRQRATLALGWAFSHVSDKAQAWQDLHRLTLDQERCVRGAAASGLGRAFGHFPDKAQAWQDLVRLTQDKNHQVREDAAYALGTVFSQIPDKSHAWQNLHRLTLDEEIDVRWRAADALGIAFGHVPNKAQAWQDLLRLAQEKDGNVMWGSNDKLGEAFGHLPDKTHAWQDLHKLTKNGDVLMRGSAAGALGTAFSHVPDKAQAWQDLHRLSQDGYTWVREWAAYALGAAFDHIPDKAQAWQDLHRLTEDKEIGVRQRAARALGTAFGQVPDKVQAWQDLVRLAQDEDHDNVQMNAYHSLGRVSVFKATKTDDKDALKKEIESAIAFFEKSSQMSFYSPARFCSPFYRSYFAIIFQDAKEEEVKKYLAEAKEAVGDSKSKNELLKAVEILAGALQESQRLKNQSFQEAVSELNAYSWYCGEAAEHMVAAEDKAPGAVKLMRICNPFLKERLEETIAEIQKKAELISPEINRVARSLSLDDPIKAYRSCMRMTSALRTSSKRFSEERSELICGTLIDIENEGDLSAVIEKIELAMAYTLPAIEAERKEILDRLRNIQSSISNLNISSGSARKDLYELKNGIRSVQDKMAVQELNMDDLSKVLKERDHAMIERLEMMRDDWLKSVERMAQDLPSSEDAAVILIEVQGLKQSKRRDVLGITGDISSIAGIFISLIGLAATLKPA